MLEYYKFKELVLGKIVLSVNFVRSTGKCSHLRWFYIFSLSHIHFSELINCCLCSSIFNIGIEICLNLEQVNLKIHRLQFLSHCIP